MKKLKTPLALSLALLSTSALAQVSYSPIAGAVRTTVAANSDALVAPCLSQSPVGSGVIAADGVNGDVITLEGTPGFTPGEYDERFYVRVRSEDNGNNGFWATIIGTTDDSLTLRPDGALSVADGFSPGDVVDIIPHWTISAIFNNSEIPNLTKILTFDRDKAGINTAPTFITYYSEIDEWYKGASPADSYIIYPDESFTLRTPGSAIDLNLAGAVNEENHVVILDSIALGTQQDICIGSMSPVPISLSQLIPSDTKGIDRDRILIFSYQPGRINVAPSFVTFYETDGLGWYQGAKEANSLMIQPGQGFIFRKSDTNSDLPIVVSFRNEVDK